MWKELGMTWTEVWLVLVSATGIYAAVIVLTRLAGQRSIASLSTFDFVVSVAMGALIGRTILVTTSLAAGVLGLAYLLALQAAVGYVRNRTSSGEAVDNPPILLVRAGEIVQENLHRAHIGRQDLFEKLRLAGVCSLGDVQAAVMERSGSISVMTGQSPPESPLMEGVVGAPG